MDVTTSLKSLLLAVRRYQDSRTAQNAAQLQKQVQEVSSLRCEQLMSSNQLLPADCVSALVELVGSPNTDPALLSTIIALLAQLGSSEDSREILHSSYNLTSAVASVIHCHGATPGEPLVLQCLQVLQKLTYNTRIFHTSKHIRHLLAFLVASVQSHSDDVIMPCLGLLANLCRDNHSVQSYVKSLDSVKPFYRTLINFLAHNSLTVVVFALSILASLTLNEKVGEKLFDAKNIHQTFQLVFNIIVNGDGTLTRNYSVDLLVDLLRNPKIADYLTRYEYFSACVSQVLGLLQSKDPDSAAKVLELLLAMCGVPGLRPLLCQVLFRPAPQPALKLRGAGRRQGAGPECGLALVQWLNLPVEGAERCLLQVLQLLAELLQESLAVDSCADSVLSFVEVLLPKVLELLEAADPAEGEVQLRRRCDRITHAASLLLVLCVHDSARSLLSHQVTAQLCLSLVQSLLSCCHGDTPLGDPPAGSDGDLSQVLAEALLNSLELMSKLRPQVKDMETSFYRVLQDQRIVSPLSVALTSHRRERVQTGLSLLFEATPLPDFPSLVLGESMAANNAYRQREAELSTKHLAVQEVPAPSFLNSSSGVSSCNSVHSLAEKIQLQECVKEPRMSDIINIYEQKLSAFACKESGLQDLLEAKALALAQSDRLLAQYRVQRAQAEAEASKLSVLLKEAERRCEQQGAELNAQMLEVHRSRADMEELLQHNGRLQRDSEEHQVLRGAYNALLNRSSESERHLKELQAAHALLNKHNDSLRKDHQALQLQNDKMAATLQEREEELTSLRSELQRRSSDLAGVRAELRAEEEKVAAREQEQRELEESLDVVRAELSKTEQARKDASIKASSLELQKVQLEVKLKQKEDELNEHLAKISMIHSMTSGKMKYEVNLSL